MRALTRLGYFLILLAVSGAMAGAVLADHILLFDFEEGTEGWENEADDPVPAEIVAGKSRHGESSLAFTHTFGPDNMTLHCRVKENFPQDYSSPEFLGFSAWIYIPNGTAAWEAKMFARSGDGWSWNTGKTLKGLQPGWHRVEIMREEIAAPSLIQDIGVQVINFREKITSRILIDLVEALMKRGDVPHR